MNTSRGIVEKVIENNNVKVIVAGVDDVDLLNHSNYNPNEGDEIIFLEVGDDPNDRILLAINDGIVKDIAQGDSILYSAKNESVTSSVKAKTDGSIVINDGTDFAVKYTELAESFEDLRDNHNTLVKCITNAVIVPKDGGQSIKTLVVNSNPLSKTDISKCKVEKFNL